MSKALVIWLLEYAIARKTNHDLLNCIVHVLAGLLAINYKAQAKSGLHHRSSGMKLRVIKLIKKLGLITFKTFLWLSKLCLKFFFLLFAITLIASNQIICFLIKTFPSFERSLLGQRKKWYCSKFWFVICTVVMLCWEECSDC